MNCKPGDLAVIVKPLNADFIGNLGRVVRVGSYYGTAIYKSGQVRENCWLVYGNLITREGGRCQFSRMLGVDGCIPDEVLRPIRDNDGEDEILRIAGKPEGVTA